MRSFPALLWIIMLGAFTSSVVRAADVDRGRVLAERWCASCHVTGATQRQATEAPPFAVVAKKDVDAAWLAYFLMSPHPKMPDMALSRNEVTDLAAYIKSLR